MTARASWVLVIALAISLGINLYGAMVMVDPLGRAEGDARSPGGAQTLVERRAAAMDPADAEILRRAFAERAEVLQERDQALRSARRDVHRLLRARTLKPDALEAALAALRQRTEALQEVYHETYLSVAPQLTAEGRRGLLRSRPDR